MNPTPDLHRRQFIQLGTLAAGAVLLPQGASAAEKAPSLPPLPYSFGALEPHIDAKTMEVSTLRVKRDAHCAVCGG